MSGLETDRWNIDFDVSKSMRYHAYRRSFWSQLDRWNQVLVLFSGTSVFVSTLQGWKVAELWVSLIVAFLAAMDVVFKFSDNARLHDGLYRDFSSLAQDIAATVSITPQIIADWRARRLKIESDEPGAMDWLERRCSAEEARARGVKVDPAWKLNGWQIALSQFAGWPSGAAR